MTGRDAFRFSVVGEPDQLSKTCFAIDDAIDAAHHGNAITAFVVFDGQTPA